VRLERLCYLPPGECLLPLNPGGGLDCSTRRALLVDRFEVTRGEWRVFRLEHGLAPAPGAAHPRASDRWPAAWMSRAEARRFAQGEGMRLLTAREWLRVAAGTRAQRWPWSSQDAESVTNSLDLGLGHPTGAGSFPLGATTAGVHDLLGNVSEWVDGELGSLQEHEADAWTLGGSFLDHKRPIYGSGRIEGLVVAGETVEPDQRSIDVGLRLCADAEDYLIDRLQGLQPNAEERARLVAVGEFWGVAARPLLAELVARPDAPPALADLLEGARR